MQRNTSTCALSACTVRTTIDAYPVKSGPYTAGVENHFGPTNAATASRGNSAGVCTYGFAWCSPAMLPYAM